MTQKQLHQCPCCDYYTLDERHDWDICRVCFWEDGDTDLDNIDSMSGCNHGLTLRQARANFLQIGACEQAMLKHVCSPTKRALYRCEPRQIV
ncbi:MAG: hypothetical protein C0467_00375 [Planctomycetaceae bacterium]|nr:hypothetical protein [Planctomycetaceae bacterium]